MEVINLNQLNLEQNELIMCYIYDNMITYINEYSKDISQINFETIFYENIKEITKIFVEHYFSITDIDDEDYEHLFLTCWKESTLIFYKNIIPRRSYKTTFIRSKVNVSKITEKINYLRSIPQPVQRTEEWYKTRYNLITASNAYKCFENNNQKNSIIYEKCKPYEIRTENSFATLNTAMHWGQKYEDISVQIYEKRYTTQIEDFGCIPHSEYKFVGASPDGINVDLNSERYGRMLEIKNIVNREIVDDPKKEYWVQMQLQMEVCNLNECDFLETRFKEYESYEEFIQDGDFKHTENNMEKGIMILFIVDNKPLYKYAPLNMNEEEYNIWEKETMNTYTDDTFISIIYWRLDEFSCKLVLRNKKWFQDNIQSMQEVWSIIEHERIHGYDHRAPQKRIKKETTNSIQGCLINIDNNINNTISSIDKLDNYIKDEIEDNEPPSPSPILHPDKNEETKEEEKLPLNRFKIHTESFDESHIDV